MVLWNGICDQNKTYCPQIPRDNTIEDEFGTNFPLNVGNTYWGGLQADKMKAGKTGEAGGGEN